MQLSNVVSPTESLGRYMTDDNYFSRSRNEVKFKAFMPPRDLRLSVFRIDGLTTEEIWEMGHRRVILAMKQPRQLYGVAEIKAASVTRVNLNIVPDPLPDRHANIVGWPTDQARHLSIAQQLAAEAQLKLRPM